MAHLAPIFWWEDEPPQEWLDELNAEMPPYVLDLPGMDFTEDQRNVFEAMIALSTMNRIFVMPPGVDEDILAVWREAFIATTQDQGFIHGTAAAGYEVGLATAEDFYDALEIVDRISPEGMELFTRMMGTD